MCRASFSLVLGHLCQGFEDNEGAVQLEQNPICTSNSKHIYIRHHFLRGLVFWGVDVIYVES